MPAPKDWSKKPDWLDKASEPSYLETKDHLLLWSVVICFVVALWLGFSFIAGRLF